MLIGVVRNGRFVENQAQAQTALSLAFAALSSGESADFADAETVMSEADYAWQTIGHHDEVNGLIHVLGKPANDDDAWKHRYYDIAAGTWTTVSEALPWSNNGHIYGNSALDTTTGDLYLTTADSLRRWTSAGGWETAVDDLHGALSSHKNGVAFHPNLFGVGERGLVIQAVQVVLFFDPETDTVAAEDSATLSTGDNAGAGLYLPAAGKTITGYQNQVLTSGGATPTIEQVTSSPIWTRGYTTASSTAYGALVAHPTDADKVLLIEKVSQVSTARRVWSTEDGETWTAQDAHPFTTAQVFVSVKDLGIWALGNSGDPYSVIWKP